MIDWQIQLPTRSFTIGAGTPYTISREGTGPKGFAGLPTLRSHDLELHTQHGDVLGRDVHAGRQLIIPIDIDGVGATDLARQQSARQLLSTLVQAWRTVEPTDSAVLSAADPIVNWVGEIPMYVQFPGQPETVLTYIGKPRDVVEQEWMWTFGRLRVLLTFECSDPWAYGAMQDSGTHVVFFGFTLAAATTGHLGANTNRAWIKVQGVTGQAPKVTNVTDNSQFILSAVNIATLDYSQWDIRNFTGLKHLTGVIADSTAEITASSPWFEIIGGVDNTLNLINGTDVRVFWLPAYR